MSNLKEYIERFNSCDAETVIQYVSNEQAFDFIYENFPRLTCPDKTIEEVFAFRCWTLRKHIKKTEDGFVFTEFLPQVGWSGKHNTINAALCHHLNETRWIKDSSFATDYLYFFLEEKGNSYTYHTPALKEMYDFLRVTGNESFIRNNAEKFEHYISVFDERHRLNNDLYWSLDGYDAMECSISGMNENGKSIKGVRPTLNSYMYGGFVALSEIYKTIGDDSKSDFYRRKAERLKEKYISRCKDGDFYKAVHTSEEKLNEDFSVEDIPDFNNAREEIGYIPFIYGMYDNGDETCFRYLFDENVFATPYGITTADKSNNRYLFEWNHECLWNGYIWPFATSQTITAFINVLSRQGEHDCITKSNLYRLISDYAGMHRLEENGRVLPWIDEVMSPLDGGWSSRNILRSAGWKTEKGGYERGKDYNHSTFIDLVIRGLIGIGVDSDELSVKPNIIGIWDHFSIENLTYRGKTYDIYYDEDGTHFNKGKGIIIEKNCR